MHGNVYEWCWDWYEGYYPSWTQIDPAGPETGTLRMLRGGGMGAGASSCRSANRISIWPDFTAYEIGFRVIRTVFRNEPERK